MAAEGQLFVEGQPPDFSLLQELLCPPCLESEPNKPVPSLLPEAPGSRESRFDPFVGMACCLQIPETKALDFLQEAGQSLSQSEPSNSSRRLFSRHVGRPWNNSHCATTSHMECCFPEATLSSFGPLDALSLISLHCSSLEIDSTGDNNMLWGVAVHVEEPQAGCDVPSRPEPPRSSMRRISRKQPKPQRSCEPLDPTFQGVTFQMQLQHSLSSKEGCRLHICPRYSRYHGVEQRGSSVWGHFGKLNPPPFGWGPTLSLLENNNSCKGMRSVFHRLSSSLRSSSVPLYPHPPSPFPPLGPHSPVNAARPPARASRPSPAPIVLFARLAPPPGCACSSPFLPSPCRLAFVALASTYLPGPLLLPPSAPHSYSIPPCSYQDLLADLLRRVPPPLVIPSAYRFPSFLLPGPTGPPFVPTVAVSGWGPPPVSPASHV
nr:formin-2-like [Anolis sagrei ordinatus]